LQDVIGSFDPETLTPVADWSARASGAFSTATTAMATLPTAVENCVRGLVCLGDDLQRTRTAAAELAGILTAGTAQAANVLTAEFSQASQAAGKLGAQVSGLQPAGEGARAALQNLECQATAGAAKLSEVASSLHSTDQELAKMGRTLKRLLELHSDQPELPLNRLITALDANTTGAANSATKLETIQGELAAVATASQEVVQRMERHIEKPLMEHRETLDRTHQTMAAVANQFEGAKAQLETTATELKPDPAASEKLVAGLDSLRQEMGETNRQIQTLVKRLDAAAAPDGGPGFFRRFMGGGPANRP
jgi:chromosome segregation ATPase